MCELRTAAGLIAVLAGALGVAPVAAQAQDAPRVAVSIDFDGPEFERRVRRALEGALPFLERWTGWRLLEGATLRMHFFAEDAAFRMALQSHGVRGLRSSAGVTAFETHESLQLVVPRADEVYLEAAGHLPVQTLFLALHEAVHQLAWRADAYPISLLPDWYVEGRADVLAARALIATTGRSPGSILHLADRRDDMRIMVERREHLPLDALFAAGFDDERADLNRELFYAQAASLVAWLEDEASGGWHEAYVEFESELARLERPAPGASRAEQLAGVDALWRRSFGGKGRTRTLERAWIDALDQPLGEWDVQRANAQRSGDVLLLSNVAWTDTNSALLHRERVPGDDYDITCEFEPLAVERGQTDVYLRLSESGERSLKASVLPDGHASILRFDGREWITEAQGRADPALWRSGWHHLLAQVRGHRVTLVLDGAEVVTADLPRTARVGVGRWGFGTYLGAVRFRDAALTNRAE
jgi:hypothetical protein